MKKIVTASLIAALTFGGNAQARQIVDRTNNFFVNLPDRFLLDASPDIDNKYVVLNAYDPEDEATFIVKISPSQISEINGLALDNERSKFRNSLIKMGLEPYVEGILHISPNHESIYTFSKIEDQGEVLNYLMAKFWAHNKEYSFFCIQPTKTLRTQEFLDSIDSFICLQHQNCTLPYPQKKERPEYDKAKDKHNDLVKKTELNAKKLLAEGKDKEAKKLLDSLPEFIEKPTEYIPMVEINGTKPLPADITDKAAHDALYSEHPEQVWARARNFIPATVREKIQKEETSQPQKIINEQDRQDQEDVREKNSFPENEVSSPAQTTPPPIDKNREGTIVIRNGKATTEYNFQPEPKPEPKRQLTKEELKQLKKMQKEKEKFEKEQAKRQAQLENIRKKQEEEARKKQQKKK